MGRARARSGPGDAGLAGATKGKVTYIEADGTGHTVELPVGENVMRGALAHDLPGIVGECGGGLACATCHCGTGSIHHIGYKSLTAEAEAAIRAMLAAKTTVSRAGRCTKRLARHYLHM